MVADPAIADQISTLGKKFNETANPVGDRCVADRRQTRRVRPGGRRLHRRLAAGARANARRCGSPAVRSHRPVWRRWPARKTVSDSRSLVSSPVVIAIRPQLKDALAQQNWGTLPDLQSNPDSLDGLNLPGWGSLRLALPLSGDSDASYLAAEAVAAASAPAGAAPSAGTGAVNTLVSGQPKLADNKATDRDGRAAERERPRRRAGARRRHHRTAAVSTRDVASRRQERRGLLASARSRPRWPTIRRSCSAEPGCRRNR